MLRRILSSLLNLVLCITALIVVFGIFIVIVDGQLLSPVYSFLSNLSALLVPAHSIFIAILVESIPFIFVGSLLSSWIHVYIKEDQFRRLLPKSPIGSVFVAAALGFLIPVCDCGTIPVARSLLEKGVSRRAIISFTLAAPVINPITILSTYFAFGKNLHMALLRVVLTYCIACTVALLVGGSKKNLVTTSLEQSKLEMTATRESLTHEGLSKWHKLRHWFEHTVEDVFGIIGFLICSAAVSSLYEVYHVQHTLIAPHHSGMVSVLFMMLLAMAFSLCSSADAFVARSFAATYSSGAVFAFLIIGQMIDIRNLLLLPKTFGLRTAIKLIVLCFLLCLLVGSLI